jgi:DNA topoisomerase-2
MAEAIARGILEYIQENLDGSIDLRKKKKDEVISMLKSKGYNIIDDDEEYKYLVKMPMDSVTEENVEKLLKDKSVKENELEIVKNTTIHKMWLNELNNLSEVYTEYKSERERLMNGEDIKKNGKKKVVSKVSLIKKTSNMVIVEDD